MTEPICPCDGPHIIAPSNLPGLSHIAYRAGTFADFRRAVLTPSAGEHSLSLNGVPVWRTDGAGDLGVMVAEWFAYIADILTFYNERIANAAYLRTAELPESVNHLIALLGYRPRPAIGAAGVLAALVTPGQVTLLPKGLRFQSKPAPGQAPQIFELSRDTLIGPPDQIPAAPPPVLLAETPGVSPWVRRSFAYRAISRSSLDLGWIAPIGWWVPEGSHGLLLQGAITDIDPGALLLLRPRDRSIGQPLLATVQKASAGPAPGGGQQTTLSFTLSDTPPDGLTAANTTLEKSSQTGSLWSLFSGAISGAHVHMAGLTRQIRPGDWLVFSAPGRTALLEQVASTSEAIWDANGTTAAPTVPDGDKPAVPMPHTVLTLDDALPSGWNSIAGSITVSFGWRQAGTLKDQPFASWKGTPTALAGTGTQAFPQLLDQPILLQDQAGNGIEANGSSGGDASLTLAELPDPVPSLQPPFTVLPNVLPVSRGKTVANETLGSGDAANPAQSFRLSQSPVTYLQQGSSWASTISLTVGGQAWTEVANFYGQPPDAMVF
ncbi:MAG TPA: hypothetical protein VFL55_12010, partial [Acetobacteraceae bacterium]|nr:hypothetical protein [Acetobacteraceae bacterium]